MKKIMDIVKEVILAHGIIWLQVDTTPKEQTKPPSMNQFDAKEWSTLQYIKSQIMIWKRSLINLLKEDKYTSTQPPPSSHLLR